MSADLSYRPPVVLRWGCFALLALLVVLNIVGIVFSLLEHELLAQIEQGAFVPEDRISANDNRQMALGITYMITYVATAIFFLCMLFRLHKNAQALGACDLPISAGWTVGWFFVPIANLFMPFRAVRDLWKASVPSSKGWKTQSTSALLGIWWALWIISSIVSQIVFRFSMNAETIDQLQLTDLLGIAESAIAIPLTLVAMTVLVRLMQMQQSKFEQFGEDESDRVRCPACGEQLPRENLPEDCPVCGAVMLTDFLEMKDAADKIAAARPADGSPSDQMTK